MPSNLHLTVRSGRRALCCPSCASPRIDVPYSYFKRSTIPSLIISRGLNSRPAKIEAVRGCSSATTIGRRASGSYNPSPPSFLSSHPTLHPTPSRPLPSHPWVHQARSRRSARLYCTAPVRTRPSHRRMVGGRRIYWITRHAESGTPAPSERTLGIVREDFRKIASLGISATRASSLPCLSCLTAGGSTDLLRYHSGTQADLWHRPGAILTRPDFTRADRLPPY